MIFGNPASMGQRSFKPNRKMTLLMLVVLPILCGLGFWQLSRMAEKEQILQHLLQQQQLQPVSLQELPEQPEQLRGRQVEITGEFDSERLILIDNRIMAGRVGYEVLALFKTKTGSQKLWINRGWIAAGPSRQELPKIEPLPGQVTLIGEVYLPYSAPILLGVNQAEGSGWPKVVQAAEVPMLSALWGAEIYPYQIRLLPAQPGLLQRPWTTAVAITPEKHLGYAVQWFALAAALLLLYLYSCWIKEESA